jgi:hypothetical protein
LRDRSFPYSISELVRAVATQEVLLDWKQYEQEISKYFQSEYPSARITYNARMLGKFSKIERQVDLLVEEQAADFQIRIIVDGKYRDKRIDVNDVEAFLGLVRDVGAQQGVMVSTEGYTKAAINRAYYDELELDLDVLNFEDLKTAQGFAAIPYAGGHGVLLPAPLGWVVDATPRDGAVACLYQRGLDLKEAQEANEWMYLNFWGKSEKVSDLESLLAHQEGYLRERFPDADIQYLDFVPRKDAKTKLRALRVQSYPGLEYTGFVEFNDFIFFCVLITPVGLEKRNLRKLRYIVRRILPLKLKVK